MGTDIHPYIEIRKDGKWHLLDPQPPRWSGDFAIPRIAARNYNVFAILANVRNGTGFAGVVTGEGFRVISEPRGLPSDLSEGLKDAVDPIEEDGPYLGDHSFSWLTFREIFGFDYSQTTTHYGVLTGVQFADYQVWDEKSGRPPRSYCGDRMGPGIKNVSVETMRTLVKGRAARDIPEAEAKELEKYQTRVSWKESYMDSAWAFLYALKWAVPEGVSYDDLRLVFGFDS